MKRIIILAVFLSHISLFGQVENGSFMFEGVERDYFVYLPSNYTPGDQWPLVFNLHGYTSNATEQYLYSGFTAVADTANFILCYPNGTPNTVVQGNGWNVGFPFATNTADDVGFLSALIDTLHTHYNINLDRVYSCGISNGGYMSYKLACELTDRIQAVASVAGTVVPNQLDDCMPSSTIPVMQIHGTADDVVPYNGSGQFALPIEELITYWTEHNDCTNSPDTVFIADTDPQDGSTAQWITYTDCDTDREVWFYKIIGGGHTWPGAGVNIGVTNKDINASVEIWRFFNKWGESISTAVEAPVESTVDIFPNPVRDQLTIDLPRGEHLQKMRVLNVMGQAVVTKTNLQYLPYQLDTKTLPAGTYFLEIHTEQYIYNKQFTKQ